MPSPEVPPILEYRAPRADARDHPSVGDLVGRVIAGGLAFGVLMTYPLFLLAIAVGLLGAVAVWWEPESNRLGICLIMVGLAAGGVMGTGLSVYWSKRLADHAFNRPRR